MKDIAEIVSDFEGALQKRAKGKSSPKTKGQVDKAWKKSKETYSKLKAQHDKLQKEADKLNSRLDATRELLMAAKQDMLHWYKTKQFLDLSGASSVVQYDNEARDVGYVIDKEEYHLDLNDARDLVKSPMKEHRRNNKTKKEETDVNDAEDSPRVSIPEYDQHYEDQQDAFDSHPNFRFVDE